VAQNHISDIIKQSSIDFPPSLRGGVTKRPCDVNKVNNVNINPIITQSDNNNMKIIKEPQLKTPNNLCLPRDDPKLKILSWNSQSLNLHAKSLYALSLGCDIQIIQEIWSPVESMLEDFVNYRIKCRSNERGGGTLINLENLSLRFSDVKEINDDMNGYKVLVGDNSFIWVIPVYLPRNSKKLTQLLFNWLWKSLHPRDIERTVLVGDWNLDPNDTKDQNAELLGILCKQFQMRIVAPLCPTRMERTLDFCVVGNSVKVLSISTHNSISDHKSIILELSVPLPGSKQLISLPHRKLASAITLNSLNKS